MAMSRYRFNAQSLTFTEEHRSRRDKLWLAVRYVLAFVIISAISYLVFPFMIETPEVRKLKRENQKLVENFDHINRRVDNLRIVLEDLQHRDDNIYRTIFEAEPVPTTMRNVGMGGVNRYEQLEQMENGQLIIETSKKLDALAQKAYIQSRSFDEIIALAQRKEELVRCVPAIMPISDRNLTRMASSFGMRMHPFYKVLKMHTGMDFTAPTGTEIYATGDGEVCRVERQQRGYGLNVIINHGFGYKSLYAHMSKIDVRVGQKVKRGQVIGLVGNTGTSVAPHLHYEVRINDQPVDPVNYYYNDLTPEQYDRMIELASMPTQSFD